MQLDSLNIFEYINFCSLLFRVSLSKRTFLARISQIRIEIVVVRDAHEY